MATDTTRGRLDMLVGRLLDHSDGGGAGRLTVTATLDLTPGGSGQPHILKALRQAGREAAEGLDKAQGEAVEDEMRELEEGAADASRRGVLGLVWVAHPVWSGDAQDADPDPGPFTVLELAAPIRSSVHAGDGPRVFEVARAAYLDRPVVLVTVDLHTMDVTRVRYGAEVASTEVDWPAHYLAGKGHRTDISQRGGGVVGADQAGPGHSYVQENRYVENQQYKFSKEASEELEKFLREDDIVIVEGIDEARQQLLSMMSEGVQERAIQLNAPPHGEDERDRYERLRLLAHEEQLRRGAERTDRWFDGGEADAIGGYEAIDAACVQGRVGTVIVHEDATDHLGNADDTRLHESSVDGDEVERLLQAALRQGAEVVFTDDDRILEEGGIVAIGRY